jgi:hypothetical protein
MDDNVNNFCVAQLHTDWATAWHPLIRVCSMHARRIIVQVVCVALLDIIGTSDQCVHSRALAQMPPSVNGQPINMLTPLQQLPC